MSWTMPPASMLRYEPARNSTSSGVTIGAIRVDTEATATDRATSPLARNAITLEAVPDGAQPTRIRPTASSGSRWRPTAISQPAPGMMT